MPRAQKSDFMQNYNFYVDAIGSGDNGDFLQGDIIPDLGQAGFATCTTPDMSTEAIEYREGHRKRTIKLPGIPTFADVSMTRGVVRSQTPFLVWARKAHIGEDYRAEVTIYHFDKTNRGADGVDIATQKDNCKQYILHDAFPLRVKPAGDLDATGSDISMAELDVAYEDFDVKLPANL